MFLGLHFLDLNQIDMINIATIKLYALKLTNRLRISYDIIENKLKYLDILVFLPLCDSLDSGASWVRRKPEFLLVVRTARVRL